MSHATGGDKTVVNDESHPSFKDISVIKGSDFELRLENKFFDTSTKAPGYDFKIFVSGQYAGSFTAIIEDDFSKIATLGNVGIEVDRKFFGTHLPSRVVNAVLPLFKKHGQEKILITIDEGNRAAETACKELSAQYLDTLRSETSEIAKRRFILSTGMSEPM